jgi:hypothetical protein
MRMSPAMAARLETRLWDVADSEAGRGMGNNRVITKVCVTASVILTLAAIGPWFAYDSGKPVPDGLHMSVWIAALWIGVWIGALLLIKRKALWLLLETPIVFYNLIFWLLVIHAPYN